MKTAITIDLNDLRTLMRQFIDEVEVNSSRTHMEWTFETFLQWLRRKRQETTDEQSTTIDGQGRIPTRSA